MNKDRNNAIALKVGAAALTVGAVFFFLMSCCAGILGSASEEILFGGVCVLELVLAIFMARRAREIWKRRASGAGPEVK